MIGEESIEHNDEVFSSIFFNGDLMMIITDAECERVISANTPALNFYGYTLEEFKKMKLVDFEADASRGLKSEIFKGPSCLNGPYFNKHKTKDGTVKEVSVIVFHKFVDDDDVFCHLISDVTEKADDVNLGKDLCAVAEQYNVVFNNVNDCVIISEFRNGDTEDVKYLDANKSALKRLGYTREEFLKASSISDFNQFELSEIRTALSERGYHRFKTTLRAKDGRTLIMDVSSRLMSHMGKKIVISMAHDVTEKEYLKDHLFFFDQLFNNTPDPIFVLDKKFDVVDVNQSCSLTFKYQKEEMTGENITRLICYEHLYSESENKLRNLAAGNIIRDRVIRKTKNNEPFLFDLLGFPIMKNGEIDGFFLTYQNMKPIVGKNENLTTFREMYEFESDGVVITDNKGHIIWVNSSFETITGYKYVELIGCNPKVLKSDRHDLPFYKTMWHSIIHKGSWEGEIWNKRKDGIIYPEHLSIFAVHDDVDRPKYYIGLLSDITDQKYQKDSIKQLMYQDALTGLYNRKFLLDQVNDFIKRRKNEQMFVAVIDIDKFKMVNDTMGHIYGDQVLASFSQLLTAKFEERALISRIGGDEFALLFKDSDKSEVIALIEDFQRRLKEPQGIVKGNYQFSCSIGVSVFPDNGVFSDDLIRNADIAMYKAKEKKDNKLVFYSKEYGAELSDEYRIETELYSAIANDEFDTYYQPIIDIGQGKIVGAEALMRWDNPELGKVSPMTFIPIAESNGSINEIGDWVMEEALSNLKRIQEVSDDFFMSVNVSVVQLESNGIVATVKQLLDQYDLEGTDLEIEITETAYMENTNFVMPLLKELNDLGVKISIDDFGTGYSSMGQLMKMDISKLKIDKSFIDDIGKIKTNEEIIKAMVSMSKALNIPVTAEGIETQEQMAFLKSLGCEYGQGYLYGKPMPLDQLLMVLESSES